MQSTGQTSKHASQPVQLSALITATSLGSFFRDPLFAIRSTLGVPSQIIESANATGCFVRNSINNDSAEQLASVQRKSNSHNCECAERPALVAVSLFTA